MLLFSESNTRFLCEVPPDTPPRSRPRWPSVPHARIGEVTADGRLGDHVRRPSRCCVVPTSRDAERGLAEAAATGRESCIGRTRPVKLILLMPQPRVLDPACPRHQLRRGDRVRLRAGRRRRPRRCTSTACWKRPATGRRFRSSASPAASATATTWPPAASWPTRSAITWPTACTSSRPPAS